MSSPPIGTRADPTARVGDSGDGAGVIADAAVRIRGTVKAAGGTVRTTLRLGEPDKHIRSFLDAEWPIAALLAQLHERGGLNQQGEHVRMAA